MSQITRTIIFVASAVVSAGFAFLAVHLTQPEPVSGYEAVGQEFFPDFEDPREADTLIVGEFDEQLATVNDFIVGKNDAGRFVIRSHHDYPVESIDKLAETAASVMDVKRGALKGMRKTEHERFGVIDPMDTEETALKGRGKRISIKKGGANGEVLTDLIIGNKVEGLENTYYVRRADEDSVYATEIDLSLSARFADWIDPDLLQVDRDNITRLDILQYQVDPVRGTMKQGDPAVLEREKFSDPWKMEGLDEEVMQVKDSDVDTLARNLDDLKIVGVRPKPVGLGPKLELDPKALQSAAARRAIQDGLDACGLLLIQQGEKPRVFSTEGELMAGTNQGVRYHIFFGNLFHGNLKEIEIGSDAEEGDESESEDEDAEADSADGDESAESDEPDGTAGRYMVVWADFDPSLLGPKPQPPVPPTPPPGYDESQDESGEKAEGEKSESNDSSPAPENPDANSTTPSSDEPPGEPAPEKEADESECDPFVQDEPGSDPTPAQPPKSNASESGSSEDEKPEGDKPEGDKPEGDKPEGDKPEGDKPEGDKPEGDKPEGDKPEGDKPEGDKPEGDKPEGEDSPPPPDPVELYKIAKNKYDSDLETFQNDLKLYEDRIETGRKKVDELNERLGPWFYVISAESFKELHLSRDELIEPKMEDDADPAAGPGLPSGLPNLGPGGNFGPGGLNPNR